MPLWINRAGDYAMVRAQLLRRLKGMDTWTLVTAAGVSAEKALMLEGTSQPTERPKMEPAADAWAAFVAGLKAGHPAQGQ